MLLSHGSEQVRGGLGLDSSEPLASPLVLLSGFLVLYLTLLRQTTSFIETSTEVAYILVKKPDSVHNSLSLSSISKYAAQGRWEAVLVIFPTSQGFTWRLRKGDALLRSRNSLESNSSETYNQARCLSTGSTDGRGHLGDGGVGTASGQGEICACANSG
jgi:hypothetical protein